jgi:hypothetical protein
MVVGEVPLSCFVGTRLCNGVKELFECRPQLAVLAERQQFHPSELVEPLLPRPHRRRNHVKYICVQLHCLLLDLQRGVSISRFSTPVTAAPL